MGYEQPLQLADLRACKTYTSTLMHRVDHRGGKIGDLPVYFRDHRSLFSQNIAPERYYLQHRVKGNKITDIGQTARAQELQQTYRIDIDFDVDPGGRCKPALKRR